MDEPVDGSVEALYRRLRGRLAAYFAACGAGADAEDMAQELFVRYLCALACGAVIGQPDRWLWRAARRLVVDEHRRRARRPPAASLSTLTRETIDRRSPDPLALAMQWDDRADVARALRRLTPEQAQAVTLRHRNGWAHRRVAEAAGICEGAAKARYRRALLRLRSLLAHDRR